MLLDNIIWLEEVESTNTYLASLVRDGRAVNGTVAAANHQTRGRGRHNRQWLTRPGENLTFSVYLRYDIPPAEFTEITLVAALAVANCLRGCGIDARLKWPNDILVGGRKICGILAEMTESKSTVSAGIVGIGLNVNMRSDVAAGIDKPATSMLIETAAHYELRKLLNTLLEELQRQLELWRKKGYRDMARRWESLCSHINQPVRITDDFRPAAEGIFEGLGDAGEMVLRLSDGSRKAIMSGDVTDRR